MKKSAFLFICLAGVLWGTSGIFVHYLTPLGLTSIQLSAIRGTVSFTVMALYALIFKRSLFKARAKEILLFFFIGLMLFATATCYYTAMTLTSVSTAVVLMYTAPVYVLIFSVLKLGEKISIPKIAAIAFMLIGCCLVSGLIGGVRFTPLGLLIGALSGITYAIYNILTKIAVERGSDAVSVSIYGFLFMTVTAIIFCRPIGIFEVAAAHPLPAIPLMIGLGICTFVLPYFLYTLSMKHIPAGTASALGIIEPMAATLFSVILFRETLSVFAVIGIALILIATVILAICSDGKTKKETL